MKKIDSNSKEYKALHELAYQINDFGWDAKQFAISTRTLHRTNQQTLFKTVIEIIKDFADDQHGSDARNAASCRLAKEIVASGLLDNTYLPMI